MEKILQTYLRRLTNLTGNNRSLLLLRIFTEQFMDLHDFDFLLNEPSFQLIHKLIGGNSSIRLCSEVDPRDSAVNEVSRRLKRLQRIDRFIFEERGSKDLHVGWPFLRGRFSEGTLVRAPLLFFPVELVLNENAWILKPRKDESFIFNKTLLLAYAYYNQVSLEEDLIERGFDDFDRESRSFRSALYNLLKKSPVEINFNPELFDDRLIPFQDFRKEDFAKRYGNGELKLYQEAVLGIFPQAGSYLVPDYAHLIGGNRYENFEDFFSERSNTGEEAEEKKHLSFFYFLNKIKEEHTFASFKMDAFQENALKAVKKGNSIVVQGPPGTGKSQLICNLISDFIARGKRVLLVCQKRAALDVVYDRLKQEEISDFAALIHDFKNDRKTIYEQIHSQVTNLYKYRLKNNSLDAIQLERQFLQASRQIDKLTEELDELKYALFDESECGLSVKELYLTSNPEKHSINLKQEYNKFRFEEPASFSNRLKYYLKSAKKFLAEGYPWRSRRNFRNYSLTDMQEITRLIGEIPDFKKGIDRETMKLTNTKVSLEDAVSLLKNRKQFDEMFELLADPDVYRHFLHILTTDSGNADEVYLGNIEENIIKCFDTDGVEPSLRRDELGRFQLALHNMFQARKNIFQWVFWLAFSGDRFWVKRVLDENGLKTRKKDLRKLTRMLDNRLNYEHNMTLLKSHAWVMDLPLRPLFEPVKSWFEMVKKAVRAKDVCMSVKNFPKYVNPASMGYPELKEKTLKLFDILKEVPGKKLVWETYLLPSQIEEIVSVSHKRSKMVEVLSHDFEDLCEFDRLQHEFYDHERSVVSKLEPLLDKYSPEEIFDLFENSLRLTWIEHIETKYPILRIVTSMKIDPMIRELQQAVKDKLNVSREIVLMRCRERTYEGVEYNRFRNMTTYRDLTHQVLKKRKIWPIRKLIGQFSGELFNLIPCWMTSPETASAIFPMEQLFDLVIFDEASQCFAERGIPAMYRGRQVVVAGDAQQLSPFDLYQARWDDGPEDIPELEVDSLLDLAGQHLMQVQLRGHYRSKTIDLIDFSNRHFYKGDLSLLPDRKLVNRGEPAIRFHKVDGTWENNRNEIEAGFVADLVIGTLQNDNTKDIGVVAFNARQQDLILDLLEQRAVETGMILPESLFVKNIENVQGDERDIIIFSLTHGPDKKGKMVMQFGSLNVMKGENRLNVAVTRAREKIHLVSSFLPQQMKTEHLKNEGLKLLKGYLEYALQVSNGEFLPGQRPPVMTSADWYLKTRLMDDLNSNKKFRMKVTGEMPFADLTLKTEEGYLALILTDDDLYFNHVSSKEAHVYNPLTLAMKNWKFRGVFSREYWQNKDKVRDRLIVFSNHL